MKYWQKYIQNVNTPKKMLLASVFGVKCCHASLQCRVFFIYYKLHAELYWYL